MEQLALKSMQAVLLQLAQCKLPDEVILSGQAAYTPSRIGMAHAFSVMCRKLAELAQSQQGHD
jgi:hypothetical protein